MPIAPGGTFTVQQTALGLGGSFNIDVLSNPVDQTPQHYNTGPALIFVDAYHHKKRPAGNSFGAGQSGAGCSYLGTCETRPRIQIRPAYSSVFRYVSGREVPTDRIYQGQEGFVFADLTRIDWSVFSAMQQRTHSELVPNDVKPGADKVLAIGTAMVAEGCARKLWIQFPYAAKTKINLNMPGGYRFLCAYLLGPDEIEPGCRPTRVRCIWHALRQYVIDASGEELNDIDQTLFDHDMSGIPTLAVGDLLDRANRFGPGE